MWGKRGNEELGSGGLKLGLVEGIVEMREVVKGKVKGGEVREVDGLRGGLVGKVGKEEVEKSDLKGKGGMEVRGVGLYGGNKL